MSDKPLTKKMFFETEDAWGIPCTRFDVMKIKDVIDALRKFQDYLENQVIEVYTPKGNLGKALPYTTIKNKFKELFGVLESHDKSNKGRDSP